MTTLVASAICVIRRIATNGESYRVEWSASNGSIWSHYTIVYNSLDKAREFMLKMNEEDEKEKEWRPI